MLALALDELEPPCLEEVALKVLQEHHCVWHFHCWGKEVGHGVEQEEGEASLHCFVGQMKSLYELDPFQCQQQSYLVPFV